jgi:cytochrome c oxidase cbb3-type subunit 3
MRKLPLSSLLGAMFAVSTALAQNGGQAGGEPEFTANPLFNTPVSGLRPGNTPYGSPMKNPLADDPQAVTRGMKDYISFNCVGCHAPNGGGGMGPSLSDNKWIYGSSPAQIFLTIYQGRPNGMPAWGQVLPETTIWELVAYVRSIDRPPSKEFGRTISRTPPSPDKQQVPSEYISTTHPWTFLEDFGNGRKPNGE